MKSNQINTNDKKELEFFEIGKKKIIASKINFCEYCMHPSKNLIVCSGQGCFTMLCSGCRTYINNLPFCNECTIDIIKNKTYMVVTKGELDE